MALIGVFVNVFEVGIEGVVVEVEVGVGIRGALPCIGNVKIFSVQNLGLGMLALSFGSGMESVQS